VKFLTLQAGMIAWGEKDMLASVDKIAWDGNDTRSSSLGDTYSRMIVADVLQARKVNDFDIDSLVPPQYEVPRTDRSQTAPQAYRLSMDTFLGYHLVFSWQDTATPARNFDHLVLEVLLSREQNLYYTENA
jgi:hypothetical protein